jgi:predicted transposase YdaD
VLKVNKFNDLAKNKLDEWIYFLKNARIKDNFSAKGLLKARKTLDYTRLSKKDQAQYDNIQEARTRHLGQIDTAIEIGRAEGLAEGEAKGEQKSLINVVINSKRNGLPIQQIQAITGIGEEKILDILRSNCEE